MEVANPVKGAVLICNLGGHLDEYGPSPHGYQTRCVASFDCVWSFRQQRQAGAALL